MQNVIMLLYNAAEPITKLYHFNFLELKMSKLLHNLALQSAFGIQKDVPFNHI